MKYNNNKNIEIKLELRFAFELDVKKPFNRN